MISELSSALTPAQLLVLHAALDDPPAALLAWERWRAEVEFDDVDDGSARLLPLVYRNLGNDSLDLEVAGRLKGLYRRWWSHNQVLLASAAEATGVLAGAGVKALAIKGAPLAALAYGDIGVRPMDAVDLLVPRELAGAAIDALDAAGWIPEHEDPRGSVEARQSLRFSSGSGSQLELYWSAFWLPASDQALWRASVSLDLAGVATLAPCPADALLLACVPGAPWSPLRPSRWIADAVTSIRAAGPEIDWERVGAEAERRRLTVATATALSYLGEEFGVAVPETLLARLASVPASPHERAAFRVACRSDSPTRTLRMLWDRHRRLREGETGARSPRGFPTFACRYWGLASAWQLPRYGLGALARRRGRAVAARSAP